MRGLYIGRFQPFHNGHFGCVISALKQVDNLDIVICSPESLNCDNPYTFEQRKRMIDITLQSLEINNYEIYHQYDRPTTREWAQGIFGNVPEFQVLFSNNPSTIEGIKENYRNCEVGELPKVDMSKVSGTNIRMKMLTNERWVHLVPTGTLSVLK